MQKDLVLLHQDEEGMDDIFIPPHEVNGAINGDIVLVRVSKETSGDRREGTITKMRNVEQLKLLGHTKTIKDSALLFRMIKNYQWIFSLQKEIRLDAVDGHKVVVEITEWPE